jgi:hypothetical protein
MHINIYIYICIYVYIYIYIHIYIYVYVYNKPIGLLWELIGGSPFRNTENQTGQFSMIHLWALGLVFLKMWVRYVHI